MITRCRSARGSAAWPTTSTAPGCRAPTTTGTSGSRSLLPNIPLVGEHAERWLQQFKDAIKASLHHGMLFEELGLVYLGPIDGHDLKTLRVYLERVKSLDGPVLLHILTNKGHGFEPAVKDPVKFHAPAPFQKNGQRRRSAEDVVEPGVHRRRQRYAL